MSSKDGWDLRAGHNSLRLLHCANALLSSRSLPTLSTSMCSSHSRSGLHGEYCSVSEELCNFPEEGLGFTCEDVLSVSSACNLKLVTKMDLGS